VGVNGGVFRATVGLQKRFGAERVTDTPLSELLISGLAVGMAAASRGLELARLLGARVTTVTVTEPWNAVVIGEAAFGLPREDYERSAIERPRASLPVLQRRRRRQGFSVRPCT
jgi:hypothetical protein